jgi:vacuolar-type H+-ATPase subunit I/STV1
MAEVPRGVAAALKEYLVPQFEGLRAEAKIIAGQQEQMSKRLDDVSGQLVAIHARLDQTNARIDAVREELGARIDAVREELGARIDAVREELGARIDQTNLRIDHLDQRLDRLYEVAVRREEAEHLVQRVVALEAAVNVLRKAS